MALLLKYSGQRNGLMTCTYNLNIWNINPKHELPDQALLTWNPESHSVASLLGGAPGRFSDVWWGWAHSNVASAHEHDRLCSQAACANDGSTGNQLALGCIKRNATFRYKWRHKCMDCAVSWFNALTNLLHASFYITAPPISEPRPKP